MRIEVKLFAAVRQIVGDDAFVCEMPVGSRVSDLSAALVSAHPAAAALISHSAFAVDSKYVPESEVLQEGTEVACVPPVSGG
jgi:molybdopterin converting factor small subunit